ncbi:MAG: NADH-quinone oxidoreductase subunit NuoK, partial [Thermoanaerobaculia bacterium]
LEGQVFTIFVITVAAGEAAVGLAIVIQVYRLRSTINIDEAKTLHG